MSEYPDTQVAGLVLAAGEGRRFGGPKALARLGGVPLVDRAVATLRDGGCEPVYVVLGARAAEVRATARLAGARVVTNPDWHTGMGSSLRHGLAALPPEAGAAVVLLVDQPGIGAEAVRRVIAAYRSGARVAIGTYAGQPRHPVLLARAVWSEVAELATGDQGARPFLRAHPELVTKVPCDGTGDPADVDTPEDLARLGDGP
ncbi:hypothetical protein TH66_03330 [Carbonactinospora thermoautotrophica]|uniref:MobA-like NTP transferase domain-containing protein n=2 Tax=Carbonactinospora thermoautotrophica TaxID=1469144 RepID=A0A132N5K6_9ACTN|nr:nucleotidyltransferase family protein [Carbonactinospora thermoautotrophica]KWX00746.1 hypothetical protein LI90_1769 [Carbonactinospora thermoautotrophica]KWX05286.1 hypothetical protein TH66_03330 [Carbonactinospora thermoautotrophica]